MQYEKKYHGYLALPRQSKLLRQELGQDLFGFYLSLVMEAIWYRGNKNFGRIVISQVELANEFNMDQTTISRKFKRLEKHRYCVIRHKGKGITLGYFPLFLKDVAAKMYSKNYANLHELYADMHAINAELQDEYANLQVNRAQTTPQRLRSSSKDDVSFSRFSSYSGGTEEIDIDEADRGIERMRQENNKDSNL